MSDFALITTDGQLELRDGDWGVEIGDEGPNRVHLHRSNPLTGWVNDVGLLYPERFPRNLIGSLALCCLGAAPQPYAGPVVITGWHECSLHEPRVTALRQLYVAYLPRLVTDILRALDREPPSQRWIGDEGWCESVRELAEHVRIGQAPAIRVITTRGLGGFGGPN